MILPGVGQTFDVALVLIKIFDIDAFFMETSQNRDGNSKSTAWWSSPRAAEALHCRNKSHNAHEVNPVVNKK